MVFDRPINIFSAKIGDEAKIISDKESKRSLVSYVDPASRSLSGALLMYFPIG